MTETLVIYQDRGAPTGGKIQVNEAELFPTDTAGWLFLRRHPTVRMADADYQESGPGQLFLYADTLDVLERLLDDVGCVHQDGVRAGTKRTDRRVVTGRKTVIA